MRYAWLTGGGIETLDFWDGDLDEARLEENTVEGMSLPKGSHRLNRDITIFSCFLGLSQCTRTRSGYWKSSPKTSVPNVIWCVEKTQGVKIQDYAPWITSLQWTCNHAYETLAPSEITSFVAILETTEIHDMNFTSFLDELFHDMTSTITFFPGYGGWAGATSNHLGWRITQRRPWTWAQCAESQDNVQSGGPQDAKVAILGLGFRWEGSSWKQPKLMHMFWILSSLLELRSLDIIVGPRKKSWIVFWGPLFLHIFFFEKSRGFCQRSTHGGVEKTHGWCAQAWLGGSATYRQVWEGYNWWDFLRTRIWCEQKGGRCSSPHGKRKLGVFFLVQKSNFCLLNSGCSS